MVSTKKLIFPGILIGSVLLILTARLLTSTHTASASTPEAGTPVAAVTQAAVSTEIAACSISLPLKVSPWCSLIQNAAQTYNVPADLIAAVMLQESGGQSNVVSSSGAVGLMQVMPRDGTAAEFTCASGPCFASRPTTQQLLDPAFNIDYGTRMLASLLKKYSSERDALKAYGPYDVGYYYADKVMTIRQSLEAD